MGLLQALLTGLSHLGYSGQKPQFNGESIGSTLHNQSSINNNPPITKNPSQLDENDPNNTSHFRSTPGNRYIDNLPK